ncbi:MAG: hypothetical protein ACLVJ6_16680 [Merdibacter sp.]
MKSISVISVIEKLTIRRNRSFWIMKRSVVFPRPQSAEQIRHHRAGHRVDDDFAGRLLQSDPGDEIVGYISRATASRFTAGIVRTSPTRNRG